MHQVSHEPGKPRASTHVRQYPDHAAFQLQVVACGCGWRGAGHQAERGRLYDIGVEVLCPACTRRLGVVLFAAEADDPASVAEAADGEGVKEGQPGGRQSGRNLDHLAPGLARMLGLFEAMTPADHERALVLLASGLPLTREAWIEAFFGDHDAEQLPARIEAHLPRPLARR